jgi:hypothetical protein
MVNQFKSINFLKKRVLFVDLQGFILINYYSNKCLFQELKTTVTNHKLV